MIGTDRITLVLSVLICSPFFLSAQWQPQERWIFGYGRSSDFDFGISGITFTDDQVRQDFYPDLPRFTIGVEGALSFNADGDLQAYTTSCEVFDAEGVSLTNGEHIRPSLYGEGYYCSRPDGNSSYPSPFSTLFINFLGSDSSVLWAVEANIDFDELYGYSDSIHLKLVHQTETGVQYQSLPSVKVPRIAGGGLTSIVSTDSTRWFVPQLAANENVMTVYALNRATLLLDSTIYEMSGDRSTNLSYQAAFSPNGTKYARLQEGQGLYLFDFDRQSGRLTDHRIIEVPDTNRLIWGLAFSPNGRYVYLSSATSLFQVDITTDEVEHIAYHLSADDTGWPVGIGSMQMGPDCRIYVSPRSTSNYLHVIHEPDLPGRACQFEPRAIRLASNLDFGLPNLPVTVHPDNCLDLAWAVDDPNSTSAAAPVELDLLRPSPNPARGPVRLGWTDRAAELGGYAFEWQLFDALGRRVRSLPLTAGTDGRLERRGLAAGVYTWTLLRAGRRVQTGRLVLG